MPDVFLSFSSFWVLCIIMPYSCLSAWKAEPFPLCSSFYSWHCHLRSFPFQFFILLFIKSVLEWWCGSSFVFRVLQSPFPCIPAFILSLSKSSLMHHIGDFPFVCSAILAKGVFSFPMEYSLFFLRSPRISWLGCLVPSSLLAFVWREQLFRVYLFLLERQLWAFFWILLIILVLGL